MHNFKSAKATKGSVTRMETCRILRSLTYLGKAAAAANMWWLCIETNIPLLGAVACRSEPSRWWFWRDYCFCCTQCFGRNNSDEWEAFLKVTSRVSDPGRYFNGVQCREQPLLFNGVKDWPVHLQLFIYLFPLNVWLAVCVCVRVCVCVCIQVFSGPLMHLFTLPTEEKRETCLCR